MFAATAGRSPVLRLVQIGMLVTFLAVAAYPTPAQAGQGDVQITRNLVYGTDQGEKLLLDVYQPPATAAPSPILILIHGGGWIQGDKDDYAPFSHGLAVAGFVVFDINYSLDLSKSPAFPREVEDVHAALAWVQSHAKRFHGDTGRIGVAGGSAGGYLAAMLGTQANTPGSAPVRAVVSLSGPMDIGALVTDLGQAVTSASGQCAPISCTALAQATDRLRGLLGCDPLQCPERLLRKASPITYVTSASPPFFLANSTEEGVPATQATLMATALQSRNVPVDLELVPGDRHGIAYLPSIRGSLLAFLTSNVTDAAPSAVQTSPNRAAAGQHGGGIALPWIVVAVALGLLAAVAAVRGLVSARARAHRGTIPERSAPDVHQP